MEKKSFCLSFCITMSSPTPSDISQYNTNMLEEQCCEMQQWHKEEQQLLVHLKEAVEAHCIECVA